MIALYSLEFAPSATEVFRRQPKFSVTTGNFRRFFTMKKGRVCMVGLISVPLAFHHAEPGFRVRRPEQQHPVLYP
jgi:hypothetical protein